MPDSRAEVERLVRSGARAPELLGLVRQWALSGRVRDAADLALGLADSAIEAGRPDTAIDALEAFDGFADRLPASVEDRVWRLRLEGLARAHRGEHLVARDLAERALEEALRSRRSDLVIPVTLQAGATALQRGDYHAAEAHMIDALKRARRKKDFEWVSQALVNLANIEIFHGNFKAAKRHLDDAERTDRDAGWERPRSSIVGTRAVVAAKEQAWELAEELNRAALTSSRRSKDSLAEVVALQNLGALSVDRGRPGQALRWYRSAIRRATDIGARRKVGDISKGLALALQRMHRLEDSAAAFAIARAVYLELGDSAAAARVTADLGVIEMLRNNNNEAKLLLNEASTELLTLGEQSWWALAQLSLAELLYADHQLSEATDVIEHAVERLEEDTETRARLLWRLASLLTAARSTGRLVEVLQDALATERGALSKEQLAWRYGLAAAHLRSAGASALALPFLDRAIQLANHDAEAQFHLRNDRGVALAELGRLEEAEAEFRTGMRSAQRRSDRAMQAQAAQNLGVTLHRRGKLKESIRTLELGARVASEIGDAVSEVSILASLGLALTSADQLGRAEETLHSALSLALEIGEEEAVGTSLGGLADLAFRRKEYSRAAEYYGKAARHHGDDEEYRQVEDLGGRVESLAAAGRTRSLNRAVQELVDVAQASDNEAIAWQACARAGLWYAKTGKLDRAAGLYAIAIVLAGVSGKTLYHAAVMEGDFEPGIAAMMEAVAFMLAHGEHDEIAVDRLLPKIRRILVEQYELPYHVVDDVFSAIVAAWRDA